jgi:hypothetical protein
MANNNANLAKAIRQSTIASKATWGAVRPSLTIVMEKTTPREPLTKRIKSTLKNAPEFDYSSFYVTTGTGTPAALLRRI